MWLIVNATTRLSRAIVSFFVNLAINLGVTLWDVGLTLMNSFSFSRARGKVVLQGCKGYGGIWPEYIPPKETDSRSCCPALNAMANHGILPRDGRNITYPQLNQAIRDTFNFAPSFCYFVPKYYSGLLGRSYAKDTIDLSDFNMHNGIEHDASLTRHDAAFQPDQGKPALDLVDDLLNSATGDGGKILTKSDLSRVLTKRRRECKAKNGQYSQSFFHKMFGSANSATLLTIFGGIIEDLKPLLREEKLPEAWEPRIRKPWGLTLQTFNFTVLPVELGVEESSSEQPIRI